MAQALPLIIALAVPALAAPPRSESLGPRLVVTGALYRATFTDQTAGLELELADGQGGWRPAGAGSSALAPALFDDDGEHALQSRRAATAHKVTPQAVLVDQRAPIAAGGGTVLSLHFVCTAEGILMGVRVTASQPVANQTLWLPPRILMKPGERTGYLFWAPNGQAHRGSVADLAPMPAYAGDSAWGPQGDTAAGLDPQHPAVLVGDAAGAWFGTVFVDYTARWQGGHSFVQRYNPATLYLYAGYVPSARAAEPLWAWLAPFPPGDAAATAARVAELAARGHDLAAAFEPFAPDLPADWDRPVPDCPPGLLRNSPPTDINDVAVYTVAETTHSPAHVDLGRKAGSEVLIRAWFKWAQAPDWSRLTALPQRAHANGALYGGGITCSALYDNENGITREQLLDMATRGTRGQLVDAWDQPGIRHGSLSSPAYLDYLFRWCREQIDAGADYLFMDEHTAALSAAEGYDDHSLADFRTYLREICPQTRGYTDTDPRWKSEWRLDPADRTLCPDGTLASFDYRAWLKAREALDNPNAESNTLRGLWWQGRGWRDDRAWKALTDRIRAYAKEQGRTVLISANGLAKYVDLQVLGVWGDWEVQERRIDIHEDRIARWHELVRRGWELAGRRMPVVFFHDWGFGDTPFPWMAVSAAEREVWTRTRGAELYAAGAFFAFPVLGPFGCDSREDGTLGTLVRQTTFYQRHKELYLKGQWLGCENVKTDAPAISLATWWSDQPRALVLHAVSRDYRDGALQSRKGVVLNVPVDRAPDSAGAISPDWDGERPVSARLADGQLQVTLPEFEAYTVVLLRYAQPPDLTRVRDVARLRPAKFWAPGTRDEFVVNPDGSVEHGDELNGFLQGMLHTELRRPPTFLVNALGEAKLVVKVRAVATAGARIEVRVDGTTVQTVELPDRDQKNDGEAEEYAEEYAFAVPDGRHRVTLDNVGGDWLTLEWLAFEGRLAPW